MQDIDVRDAAPDPFETMEQEPRFEQRRVEALSIETDQRACLFQLARDGLQQRPFILEPRQEVLPCDKRTVRCKPPAANEEGMGSGAAVQTSGL
jgi:hypothetical protein